ncbi:ABC transporter permease subunit [Paenibacillus sp. GD4]|uniref:ABC transporter permease subunit n=1 Tax=Paenibacillus sp. GD4 TaxID=3068890 RepID=UPI002796C098|nr:ABC transporter permease subunit [Paenibacillus sp. GD4]MDQ1911767.1 ABC transporter permease subunit [Paenibacillus sp. GD4]
MNRNVWGAILRKDIGSAFASRKVWVPMVVLSLLLCGVMPVAATWIGIHTDWMEGAGGDAEKAITELVAHLPDNRVKEELLSLPSLSLRFVYFMLNFMLVPFYLLTAIINSSVSAANSFVGEKERRTLESLLFAPISMTELFTGKVLAAFLPSYGIALATFVLAALAVNGLAGGVFASPFFLDASWLLLMGWLVPALVLFSILLNVLISARVKTFQEAQQFGGLLVLPVIGLLVSQSTGLVFLSPLILFAAGGALAVLDVLLLIFLIRRTSRNQLFESQIH